MASSQYPIAVFISGTGSNFVAIHQATINGEIPGHIACVISSSVKAGGLEYAADHQLPHFTPDTDIIKDEEKFAAYLLELLQKYETKLVVLAGFLKKIPARVIHEFSGQIINIHPALLPAFGGKGMYGKHVHRAVLDYGCKLSGATVHLVDDEYDCGAPILQDSVPVLESDTPEDLAARVLKIEHQLLPKAVALFASGAVEINGRQVKIKK